MGTGWSRSLGREMMFWPTSGSRRGMAAWLRKRWMGWFGGDDVRGPI